MVEESLGLNGCLKLGKSMWPFARNFCGAGGAKPKRKGTAPSLLLLSGMGYSLKISYKYLSEDEDEDEG
jgi:hypothetical protein